MEVSKTAIAATCQFHALPYLGKVRNNRLLILIQHFCPHGDTQHDVISILARALAAHAGLSVLGKEVLLIPKIDKRVQTVNSFGPDRSTAPAVTAIGSAVFDILFAAKADTASAARAGANIDLAEIKELHL